MIHKKKGPVGSEPGPHGVSNGLNYSDCRRAKQTNSELCRPTAGQPGTLVEQFECLLSYYNDPQRQDDRDAAWNRARAHVLPQVRQWG